MPIDDLRVGQPSLPVRKSWTPDDALLYALAVGAGQADPFDELEFTTDNTEGRSQQALPTFANVAMGSWIQLPPDVDTSRMLHAEQAFELHQELRTEGEVETTSEVTGLYDKGSGALLIVTATARNALGHTVATLRSSVFLRGYGGFGGDRGPAPSWAEPTRGPDHVATYSTRHDQALLYRLTGDRNPLHSDPAFSARGGFPRPILHGMCTYGITGRALLHAVAGSEPKRFKAMSGRFTRPFFPGDSVTVSMWVDGSSVRFRSTDSAGQVVIDHGTAVID